LSQPPETAVTALAMLAHPSAASRPAPKLRIAAALVDVRT
jgi:hypothetical protein